MIVDTHIHLFAEQFNDDLEQLIAQAAKADVRYFLMPNIDLLTLDDMFSLNDRHPECLPMVGLHPCDVKDSYETDLAILKGHLDTNRDRVIAVGETGIDLHWDKSTKGDQVKAFNIQLDWCMEFELPVVIHSRESIDLIIDLLESRKQDKIRGVFHCFTGNLEHIRRIIELDFYFGIGGVVTFKNGGLDKVLHDIPADRLLLETDGPYLAPAPHRGKRNEPSYIRLVAQKVSEVLDRPESEIEELTTRNASVLFRREFNRP